MIGLGRDRQGNNLLKIKRTVFLKTGLLINNICSMISVAMFSIRELLKTASH